MHFQLWFPGGERDAAALLDRMGLSDFIPGCRSSALPFGLGAVPGTLVHWSGDGEIDERVQQWTDLGTCQVGLWNESPCSPEDLARDTLLDGYECRLGDGQNWRIPNANRLPSLFRLIGGKWTAIKKTRFAEFWNQSKDWNRRLINYGLNGEAISVSEGISIAEIENQLVEFCVAALRLNYRLSAEIASVLNLLDTNIVLGIVERVVHGMGLAEESARRE